MTGEVRPIAMGVGKIKFGTVGDGVPGADLKDFPLPTKGSVVFNFADPKEVKVETEGSDEPLYVEFVKIQQITSSSLFLLLLTKYLKS